MKYRCSCGNESTITFSSFQQGHRCSKCGGNEKHTYEDVRQYFLDHYCELLETFYKDANTKMRYRCSCGNIAYIRFNVFQRGQRCKECGNKKTSEKLTRTQEDAEKIFRDGGCIMKGKYIGDKFPVEYICECGNKDKISLNNFKKGRRCKQCGIKKRTGENHHNWNSDRDFVNKSKNYRIQRTKKLEKLMEKHPNFKNVNPNNYVIDHINPVYAFLEHEIYDYNLINHPDNLQPLTPEENRKKWHNYNKQELYEYCKNHGVEEEILNKILI